MPTSFYNAYIPQALRVTDTNHPLDSYNGRVLTNNINHLGDQFFQVRVNDSAPRTRYNQHGITNTFVQQRARPGQWTPLVRYPFIVHQRSDESPLVMRWRIGGVGPLPRGQFENLDFSNLDPTNPIAQLTWPVKVGISSPISIHTDMINCEAESVTNATTVWLPSFDGWQSTGGVVSQSGYNRGYGAFAGPHVGLSPNIGPDARGNPSPDRNSCHFLIDRRRLIEGSTAVNNPVLRRDGRVESTEVIELVLEIWGKSPGPGDSPLFGVEGFFNDVVGLTAHIYHIYAAEFVGSWYRDETP